MLVAKPPRDHLNSADVTWALWRENWPSGTGDAQQGANIVQLSTLQSSKAQGYINTEYRYRLSKGMLVQPTPWEQYTATFDLLNGNTDVQSTSSAFRYYTVPAGVPKAYWYYSSVTWVPDYTFMRNMAISKDTSYFVQAAASKIYSSGWDTLTFVAELSKTWAMFNGIMSRLTSLAREGKLEKMWLESRYGWRTLIFDLQDLNKVLSNLDGERRRFKERVGSDSTTTSTVVTNSTAPAWADTKVTVVEEIKIGLRGHVISDISPPKLGFNPVTTAWELARLSFVVDWVLNVGQFLESLSFLALSREHYACGGVKIERKASIAGRVTSWKAGFSGIHEFNAERSETFVLRTPATVSTIPLVRLRIDWLKSLDLVSLFIQALRR